MRYHKDDLIKELDNMEAIHNKKMELLDLLDSCIKSEKILTWAKICDILKEPSRNPIYTILNYINNNKPYNDELYYKIYAKVEEIGDSVLEYRKKHNNEKYHDINYYAAISELIYEIFIDNVDAVIKIMWDRFELDKYNSTIEGLFKIAVITLYARRIQNENSLKCNRAMWQMRKIIYF